ncbi:23S rRNA (adenine(2030)-N(6))-methyltransferase RlmJ [Aeromonas simiae]|uniref:23S rRNA (adenine(2030)-N(6))-methyltransferase RlmJ n=1 Tax=Aeromonas simiae TaxID=218936 RepID=UPI00266BD3EC|nr:23S rRNA (adenine(2030)-N(6))-methyltransferase RlmJ [Aeromonas simiae]MDO2950209.1 23S rRNA (adenine(2030)-N(6))-methyltransferase RlmJ [Aeromonas simiae]MDO2953878.1 23S rRNA (adenine(2030)-N(6))-methyltransferase RlmJ [Aeromonas simiae]MDO2957642.1 23S rRNA (adenine(2030)-N(6))-methyltransferase RlmJ [Aeromonas simiae]
MLSYRHAFHAGNHADVLKHAVQALILESLKKKEKPFIVLDTHAGGGLYDLRGEWAQKKAEFADGIGRLWDEQARWGSIEPYLAIVRAMNDDGTLTYYPGSPELSRRLTRTQDKVVLMELHNNEVESLRGNMQGDERVTVHHRDGFEGLVALLPPTPRRGLVLVDPPYELKEDYFRVVETLKKAQKRWATGIYAIWYPILGREADRSRDMLSAIAKAGLGDVLVAELEVAGQTPDWGMNGSGMVIVSPPWQLDEQIDTFLKPLCAKLAQGPGAQYRVEWLSKVEA